MYMFSHFFIDLSILLLSYSFIHLFIHVFIHPFIHSYIFSATEHLQAPACHNILSSYFITSPCHVL